MAEFGRRPELVEPWRVLASQGEEAIRLQTVLLKKIQSTSKQASISIKVIGERLKGLSFDQKVDVILHLEYSTFNGRVLRAGDNSAKYGSCPNDASVPQRYSQQGNFNNLTYDPAVGKITAKTRQEAMVGLEGVNQGILDGPIVRDGSGSVEFFDADGLPWDVKGPRGGKFFRPKDVGKSILKEIRDKGPVPNHFAGQLESRRVLLDVTYIIDNELGQLRNWLDNNLTEAELGLISEINVNLK